MKPTCLSLFTGGVAGFDIAAEAAGFRVVAQCEYDPRDPKQNAFNRTILQQNWREMKLYGDIKDLTADVLRADGLLGIDLIVGGPPCQPTSLAEQRRGEDDDRWLWGEVIRVVAEVQPCWCCFENPLGLLSMGIDTVLSQLEGLGYETGQVIIPACATGAPHRRNRVWIMAHRESERRERGGSAWNGWTGPSDEGPTDSNDVAHTASQQRQPRPQERRALPPLSGDQRDDDHIDGSGGPHRNVAYTGSAGRQERHPAAQPAGQGHGARCSASHRAQGQAKPELGGGKPDGPTDWLANPRWAAPPGPYQNPYEPPRTTAGKIPFRRQQITALGNAIVWPVAYHILKAIRQQMEEG